ncbi:MAG: cyclase family protein [Deltaproteobacteria bacterium]|nr:cyclase family protein [Deltaproteobacteria bacterium]
MSTAKIIDLSVPIQPSPPASPLKVEIEYVDHKEGTKVFGPIFGLREDDFPEGNFSAVEKLTLTTHSGTHVDAPWHYWPTSEGKPSRTIDEMPLEWFYHDGVVLDLTQKGPGEEISVNDLEKALTKIDYSLKPFDIVLLRTGATKYYGQPNYTDMHPGATRESTLWLVDQGIRVMGIDAWGWDKPFPVMAREVREGKKEKLWAAHFAGKEKEYCHIENLTNLDKIPRPFGFKVSVFPVKIERAGGAWVRAVAIIED